MYLKSGWKYLTENLQGGQLPLVLGVGLSAFCLKNKTKNKIKNGWKMMQLEGGTYILQGKDTRIWKLSSSHLLGENRRLVTDEPVEFE